jgi:uncharacterized protein YndB with AHSA1/START domain
MTTTTIVSVSRVIGAPPDAVFALLADPARHPSFDGSGMVRDGSGNPVISAVGDTFTMKMHNDEMGDYVMINHVVEYELDRRIMWEPEMHEASRPEDMDAIGERARHRWGYELQPEGAGSTRVTEIFDCSEAPEWLRNAVKNGERWRESMTASLEWLAELTRPAASGGDLAPT